MARPSPEKLALLRKMLAEKGIGREPRATTIPRCPPDAGDAQLSNGQARLWFLDQFEPGTSLYNDALALTIRRAEAAFELDVERLRRAFAEVVRRHEVLRTTFHASADGPRQRVHPVEEARVGRELPFRVLDLRTEETPEAALERELLADVQAPFDLAGLPLLRALIARTADDTWVFGLAMHHIVSDGVSYGVVYHELGALYRAFTAERPSPLPELPVQFADFAQWEHDRLTEEQVEAKLAYWRRKLGGELPALRWPSRPGARPAHRGAYHRFRFSDALYGALQRFCRDAEVTSNWVLMAAYLVLLHTLAGQEDLRIGTPSSTRKHPELEQLVGFFVQTVILRVDLSDNPDFHEVLRRTQAAALEASEHEDAPFDRIVHAVRPRRARSHEEVVPLIQAWIAPMKDLMDVLELPGATSSYTIVDGRIARFDFALILDEARGGVEGFVEYDTDLFEASVVAELFERYTTILRRAVLHPETTLRLFRETVGPAPAPPGAAPGVQRREGPKKMTRAKRRPRG